MKIIPNPPVVRAYTVELDREELIALGVLSFVNETTNDLGGDSRLHSLLPEDVQQEVHTSSSRHRDNSFPGVWKKR